MRFDKSTAQAEQMTAGCCGFCKIGESNAERAESF
jgi:hypothetical protein